MNRIAARLVLRLIAIQFMVGLVALVVAVAFAPRLLLLDTPVIVASLPSAIGCAVILATFAALSTLLSTRRLRPLLRALTGGSSAAEPGDLFALYMLPARITVMDSLAALTVSVATILPPLRPGANDFATQGSLVLLALTFVSAASLPMFVMMRSQVARVMELAPVAASREALALAGLDKRRLEDVTQGAADCLRSGHAVEALERPVPPDDPLGSIEYDQPVVERFQDVLVELAQTIEFLGLQMQLAVEPAVLDRRRRLARNRGQQREILAVERLVRVLPAKREHGDRAIFEDARNEAGDACVAPEFDFLRGEARRGNRVVECDGMAAVETRQER